MFENQSANVFYNCRQIEALTKRIYLLLKNYRNGCLNVQWIAIFIFWLWLLTVINKKFWRLLTEIKLKWIRLE